MIPRYSRPEMSAIWSDQGRFQVWLEIETLALEAMVKEGIAPAEALEAVRTKACFDVERIGEIEEEVKHDVIAFLTNVAESVGPLSRFVHRGMTSSDLLDTGFAVQLSRSSDLLLSNLDQLLTTLKERAFEHKLTPCVGRTHGIHAEPVTFGFKLASFYAEFQRHVARLKHARATIACGKISGAVGTYAGLPPSVEKYVMTKLNLQPETVATQVVARDRHAEFFSVLAGIAGSVERCAIEIRHLQRTEVREVEEFFSAGQKGSSAMPHKRNPVLSENITGLARLIRGYAVAAFENVALWHERDISHSSVERVIAPDACIALDFMLGRLNGVLAKLVVKKDRMLENLETTRGLVFSGALLVALVDGGMVREDAYRLVQKHAMAAWEGGADLKERVMKDVDITAILSEVDLGNVFKLEQHLRHIDLIFERTFAA